MDVRDEAEWLDWAEEMLGAAAADGAEEYLRVRAELSVTRDPARMVELLGAEHPWLVDT